MKTTAQLLAAMLVLAGCSNSSDNSAVSQDLNIEKSGKVIDGYISKADVCLDLNNNLKCDSNEPFAKTDGKGEYKLVYSKKLPEHVALLAYGGKNSATKLDYKGFLKAPAEYDNITPVTTLVAYQKRVSSSLQRAEKVVADLFNLDIKDLPKDHVAWKKIDKKLFKASMRIEKFLNIIASLDSSKKRDLKRMDRVLKKVARVARKAQSFIDALSESASQEYNVDKTLLNNNLLALSDVIDKETDKNSNSDKAEQAIELAASKTKEYTQANKVIDKEKLKDILQSCKGNYLACLDNKNQENNQTNPEPQKPPKDKDKDTIAPTISLNGDNPQIIEVATAYKELGAKVSDNKDKEVALIIDNSKVDVNSLGEYKVRYSAQDKAGNQAEMIRVVKVVDTTAPVITLKGSKDITLELGSSFVEAGFEAVDNYDGNLTNSVKVQNPLNVNKLGSYTITYSVEDSSGNSANATRAVKVVDTKAPNKPTVLPVADIVNKDSVEVVIKGEPNSKVIINNKEAGSLDNNGELKTSLNLKEEGKNNFEVMLKDSANNLSEKLLLTITKDTTAPAITLNGDNPQVLEFGSAYSELGAKVSDNIDKNIKLNIDTSKLTLTKLGEYQVIYSAKDKAGNEANATRAVKVVDTKAPTIKLLGASNIELELGKVYKEQGFEAVDNYDGNITNRVKVEGKVDSNTAGDYTLIYKVSDSSGNEAKKSRVVKVIKQTLKTVEPLERVYNFGDGNYTLQNAPLGMRIIKNGLLTWTPSPSQVGDINVTILKDGAKVASLIAKVEDSGKEANGYFVDMTFPALSRDEDGSEEHPYGDIERACGHAKPGDIFYARGGVYTTPEYMENNNSNRSFKVVGCKGTADKPVIFKPWGNESVKILSDATTGIAIFNSEHVIVDGFEVEGVSQKISFEEAVGQWWNDLKYYNGSGISINHHTHDIVVQNCIVHDVPASGIKSHGATHITIKNNIVYNTNWWTTLGTTGVGIVAAPPLEGEDNKTYYNKIEGNLLFGSEQRLYSRVWFKKGSEFVIDEGEAVLVQEVMRTKTDENGTKYRTDYEGRYLVKNNLLAYNGAGIVINISNKSDVINNTLYMTGTTTLNPYTNLSYSCITANSSYDVKMIKNIVKAKENGIVIWYNKEVKDLYKEENHVSGHVLRYDFMDQDGLVIYDKNATLLKKDFTPIDELTGIGADSKAILAKAKKLGIEIKPTNYVIDYPKLTQAIFDAMPDDVKVLRIDDTSSSRNTSIYVKLPNKDQEYYLRVPNRYLEGVKLPKVSQE